MAVAGSKTNLESAFAATLNRQGYGFHYSLMRHINKLAEERRILWSNPVPEFPVLLNGANTRIDFVLSFDGQGLYLAAECKRVNPALGAWCFAAQALRNRLSHRERDFYVEVVSREGGNLSSTLRQIYGLDIYQIGIEVKACGKGDSGKSGRGAIEDACTQVLRGANGLTDLICGSDDLWPGSGRLTVVPVIFTTAKLYVTDTDLGTAELRTGNLDAESASLREVDWLVFHYPQSQVLRHSLIPEAEGSWDSDELAGVLYRESMRSVAIVAVSGVESFLAWQPWQIFSRSAGFRKW